MTQPTGVTKNGAGNAEVPISEGEYFCAIEWHLAKLTPFTAIIYGFAFRLAQQSRRFYASAQKLAEHFAVTRWTIQRGIRQLESAGFLKKISSEPFKPSVYEVLSHKEWAQGHPGECTMKTSMPW